MAESLSALYLQNPALAQALRRQQFGQSLMAQGMDTSPIRSPWQGLSRLAQALVGGYEARKGEDAIKDYGAKAEAETGDFAKRMGALLSGGGAPAPAPAAPATPPATPPTPDAPPSGASMTDDDALVRTVFGEARGETPLGQQAVAAVIRNRAAASGKSIRDVVMAPSQFEPWGNPQTRAQLEALDPNSPEYKAIASVVLGTTNDPTGGATHFYSPKAQAALGRQPPSWATGQGLDIGNHRFYNLPYGGGGGGGGDAIPVAGNPLPPGAQPAAAPAPAGAPAGLDARSLQALAFEAVASRNPQIRAFAPMLMQMAKGEDQTTTLASGGQLVDKRTGRVIATNTTPNPSAIITNDLRPQASFDVERGKTLEKRLAEWEEAGGKAAGSLNQLRRVESFLDNFVTGAGSQTSITLGQLAERLNVPEETRKMLGIDPNKVASGEAIRAEAARMLVNMIGAGGFPAQGFSNADRMMLERAMPGLENSPEGNRVIIKGMRAAAEKNIEISRAWRDFVKQNGGKPRQELIEQFQADILPGIQERDVVVPLLQEGGWLEVPTGGQGGGPQPGTVENGYRFRGGDPSKPESWERVP